MPSLHELIDNRFGVRTREREDDVTTTVGTSSTQIVRNDSSRIALVVVNLGQNDMFLRKEGVPSSTTGIRVGANGGSMSLTVDEDFSLVGKEWFGIAPRGSVNIYTLETLIEPGIAGGEV